ncbi:MAG: Na+/H+ antiporter NhaC family protein, partial [Gemmatimonadota bacterium]|nr:Na+/H+ antiporter NhaC family protein [Gemmatimonadota bacterium]
MILASVPFTVAVRGGDDFSTLVEIRDSGGALLASGPVAAGETRAFGDISVAARDALPLQVRAGDTVEEISRPFAPGWFSILPPLIAIVLALVFKEVITALLAGIWLGALAVAGYNPLQATWRLVDQYMVPALSNTDSGHTQIVVFSLMLGGMVGIISRNGGTRGVVRAVAPLARNRRRGKIATSLAGLGIFFDDYANTLVVGNTMRPITDGLKVSREKLAYLVDSTAAPVAALVPVSTWVGYEVSLIAGGLDAASGEAIGADAAFLAGLSPYTVFLETIPYLFYPLLALAFVFLTSYMNRDFGPMARAEARAASDGGVLRPGSRPAAEISESFVNSKEGVPERWWNAGLPVATVVLVVLGGLYTSGRAAVGADASLRDVFGAADPFMTLLWGSLSGCVVAAVLSISQRLLDVRECIDAGLGGVKAMLIAMVILTLAWSLGAVTQDVGTAAYVSQLLGGNLPLFLLPALVFITSGAMAFATGTSWTTMAILIPLVIPLTVSLAGGTGFADGSVYGLLLATTSSVLAGAIWG